MKLILYFFILIFSETIYCQYQKEFFDYKRIVSDTMDTSGIQLENIQTVYIYLEESQKIRYMDDSTERVNLLVRLQDKLIKNIHLKNIDTLYFYGLDGTYNYLNFLNNNIDKVNNVYIFHEGEFVLNGEIHNNNNNKRKNINTLLIDSYATNIVLNAKTWTHFSN